ncbi:MAG TPA: FliM/FliN family flagellar motor switch protein [Sandaracinaceae bacterium LLY-WYZ-13_1]|nr:FliM/FliN family flagellar motor switch protein [Sandaracinaceae bacterium LLY-WYZ-13_1]
MFGEEQQREEPLLTDEETSALLDAMREEEQRGEPEARKTDLGSPEGPLREALGRADASAAILGKAARTQLLRQTARGVDVELLPAEIVPRDVLASSIDPRALVYSLRFKGETQGMLAIDSGLARVVLDRCMGAPEREDEPSAGPDAPFSDLDRRILEPFPQAVVDALSSSFLAGRALQLGPVDESEVGASVRFEPMLRMGLRFGQGERRDGELLVALTAAAVGNSSPKARAEKEALAEKKKALPEPREVIQRHVLGADVDLIAVLGRTPSSVRALLGLQEGDVLRLDGAPGQPVQLCVEDVVVAHGNPVVRQGDLAIEVTETQ